MVSPACPWPLRTCQPFSGFLPACFYGSSVFLSCFAKGELACVTHVPSMDSSLFRIEFTWLPYNLRFLMYSKQSFFCRLPGFFSWLRWEWHLPEVTYILSGGRGLCFCFNIQSLGVWSLSLSLAGDQSTHPNRSSRCETCC